VIFILGFVILATVMDSRELVKKAPTLPPRKPAKLLIYISLCWKSCVFIVRLK
jgi:hypothetical protein